MFGLSPFRLYAYIGIILMVLGLVAWAGTERHWRIYWKERAYVISIDLTEVTEEIGAQSGNPDLKYTYREDGKGQENIVSQVRALGAAKKSWQDTATLQSERIASLNEEQQRLERLNAELRRKAEAAIAQRNVALNRLENIALTPSQRRECEAQLQEAEEALDLVFREGL